MSATDPQAPESSDHRRPTVFLSYASEDRRAAQILRDALPAYGLEVWYDESDLVGGDAWDQKIRRQIRECDYFMPVISKHTEVRHEGYFRREWRLAVERTLDMADDHIFLLPVAIDATPEAGARVPEKFRAVQWLRLPGGQPSAALEALCRRLVSGDPAKVSARVPSGEPPSARPPPPGPAALPPFPHEEPGQRTRFILQVVGWTLQSAWAGFRRFPKWVRIGIYCWIAILLMSRGCTSPSSEHLRAPPRTTSSEHLRAPPRISSAQADKLKDIGERLGVSHPGPWTAADTAHLISQIAKEIPEDPEDRDDSTMYAPVLAIPFSAPTDDGVARKLAASAFGQMYGRLAVARHGHVALADKPLPILDPSVATVLGRTHHSTYIVYGAIDGSAPNLQLTVKIVAVDDGAVKWSKSYPVADADAGSIAEEVSSKVPSTADDE